MNVYDLLMRTLWRYDANDTVAVIYSWFNIAEALAWFAIAVYVVRRYAIHRRTWWEVVYGVAFIVFGLSDWRESYSVEPWLILGKGVMLAVLMTLRVYLVRRHYVGWKF